MPLGAGRTTIEFLPTDPPGEEAVERLREHARATLEPVAEMMMGQPRPNHVVGSSKAIRSLAKLAGYPVPGWSGTERMLLPRHALGSWIPRLARLPASARQELPGITADRTFQIVAAAIVMFTGWKLADPIVGAGIGLFIVPRTWILLKQAIHILMEGTPPEIDISLLEDKLKEIPGITAVHDLHVWTITSGVDAMSCHLVVTNMADAPKTLVAAKSAMETTFDITHTTIQIEDQDLRKAERELKY